MTRQRARIDLLDRQAEVRRLLRERHAGIEPDARFADRIVARLPRNEAWSFDWAVRRVLPVSLAIAMALTIAIVVTGGSVARTTASASIASTPRGATDPLEWLLEGRQAVR